MGTLLGMLSLLMVMVLPTTPEVLTESFVTRLNYMAQIIEDQKQVIEDQKELDKV